MKVEAKRKIYPCVTHWIRLIETIPIYKTTIGSEDDPRDDSPSKEIRRELWLILDSLSTKIILMLSIGIVSVRLA